MFNNAFLIYFFDLWLLGLGFKLRHLKKTRYVYQFLLRYSCYRYLFESKNVFFKKRFKTRLFVFSPFLNLLYDFIVYLLFFRAIRPYQIRGIFGPKSQFLLLKQGKIRT